MVVTTDAYDLYSKLDENIEKMSKLLYILGTKTTVPAVTMPPLIIFTIDYFSNNLSDKYFYLPLPVR